MHVELTTPEGRVVRLDAELALGVDRGETTLFALANRRLRSFPLPRTFGPDWRPTIVDGPETPVPERFNAPRFIDAHHALANESEVYDLRTMAVTLRLPSRMGFGRVPHEDLSFEGRTALLLSPGSAKLTVVDALGERATRSFAPPSPVTHDVAGFASFHEVRLAPNERLVAWVDPTGVWAASLANDPPVWIHLTQRAPNGELAFGEDSTFVCVIGAEDGFAISVDAARGDLRDAKPTLDPSVKDPNLKDPRCTLVPTSGGP